MPTSLTLRVPALLAIVLASIAAACADSPVESAPPVTLQDRSAGGVDSGRPTPPPARPDSARPDSARPDSTRPDSTRPGGGTRPDSTRPDTARAGTSRLSGMTVENVSFPWRDAAGVTRDSVGYRGVAGVRVIVYAVASAPDSTRAAPVEERQVATLTSDATGKILTEPLPDGWYVLRASVTAGGATRTASATASLVRGYQRPSYIFLNLR